jgi:hypothetical protein
MIDEYKFIKYFFVSICISLIKIVKKITPERTAYLPPTKSGYKDPDITKIIFRFFLINN